MIDAFLSVVILLVASMNILIVARAVQRSLWSAYDWITYAVILWATMAGIALLL